MTKDLVCKLLQKYLNCSSWKISNRYNFHHGRGLFLFSQPVAKFKALK